MHGHVSKRTKMHRKPTGGTNKHGKHIIAWSDLAFGDASQVVTSKQDLVGVRYNHTNTNSLRALNMAKPRTR